MRINSYSASMLPLFVLMLACSSGKYVDRTWLDQHKERDASDAEVNVEEDEEEDLLQFDLVGDEKMPEFNYLESESTIGFMKFGAAMLKLKDSLPKNRLHLRTNILVNDPNLSFVPFEKYLNDPRYIVHPVIRLMTPTEKCGRRPDDLSATANAQGSYSKKFFDFMKTFGENYKDRVEVVVIENEMNDPDFWCSSPEDYIKVLKTAKAALKGSHILVSDGGIQSDIIGTVVANFMRSNAREASHFFGDTDHLSPDEFLTSYYGNGSGPRFPYNWGSRLDGAQRLIDLHLYDNVDIVNVHLYNNPDVLRPVISYLRKISHDKQVLSNEVGIQCVDYYGTPLKDRDGQPRAADQRDVIKRLAMLKALDVTPSIWFPIRDSMEFNAGYFADENDNKTPSLDAFSAFAAHLSDHHSEAFVKTEGYFSRIGFKFDSSEKKGYVAIFWANTSTARDYLIPDYCKAFDMNDNPITTPRAHLTRDPVLYDCTYKP